MPEGPSLILVKENIRRFEGKRILEASGYAKIDYDLLVNKTIKSIKTWGKHLFICLPKTCIEIHLRMFGSYTINKTKKINPKLSLVFADSFLNFYVVDVKLIDNMKAFDVSADVMSDEWDPKKALKKMREKPDMAVCDALMNQQIYSGVGNIIKNEVLWRVKLHPETTTGALSAAKLNAISREAVKYAFEFLEQRRKNTLSKNWKAYEQTECARCGGDIVKKATGKLKRGSYWCPNCQKKTP